ncbi:MAG: carbohydrate ABC transporter permease [Anaerolineae bacterium]|nr:carbohydrate ABC transporter permease [Anaerolineae bacterium]
MAETARPLEITATETQQTAPRKPIAWGKIISYAILIIGLIQALLPFYWMLSSSLMSVTEVNFGYWFPSQLRFENYALAWEQANFAQFMWNSVRITGISLIGQMLVCIPAAYAFARMRFIGRDVLFGVTVATLMIPSVATMVPNYLTVIWIGRLSQNLLGFGWLNNWPSLTIPFMASAFTIFLLRQFFAQIPDELWDAARIDGAGHLRFLRSVVVPLSKAPIMTTVTFSFIGSWNALLWPLLVTQTDEWRPVAVGLTKFINNEASSDLHLQMAAAVMMIIPILIMYFFTQKQFTEGIATSGLKG